jgi:ribosomal-protein-alanine acetyltransferase
LTRAVKKAAPIRIRRARRGDLDALVALENGVFTSDRMSRRQLRHHLQNPHAEILVAARGGDVIAAAVAFFHSSHRSARLYSIAVAPSARGIGLGERLLSAIERVSRSRRRDAIRLEVRADNKPAQRLYERLGYRRIGIKRGFYEDGHDALRYEKRLARA